LSAAYCTEKQQHNLMVDEEVGKIRAELEIAVDNLTYFDNLIIAADNLRKFAEVKIIETQSKKLDSLSNKLDSQIQSISELIRKAETKKDEALTNVLDAEVNLIVLENRILHTKVISF
jgi:hypothetical protein